MHDDIENNEMLKTIRDNYGLSRDGSVSHLTLPAVDTASIKLFDYSEFLSELRRFSESGDIGNCLRVEIEQGGSVDYYLFDSDICLIVANDLTFTGTIFSLANYCVLKVRLEGEAVESVDSMQHGGKGVDCHLITTGSHGFNWQLDTVRNEALTTVNLFFHPESLWRNVAPSFRKSLSKLLDASEALEPDAHFVDVGVNSQILKCAKEILSLSRESPVLHLVANGLALKMLAEALVQFDARHDGHDFGVRLKNDDITRLCGVRDRIEVDFAENLTIESLALHAGLNRRKLTEGFKALFGSTVSEYLVLQRMGRAQELLNEGYPVGVTSERVGYSHQANFSKAFKRFYGMSPREQKRRQRDHHQSSNM